MSVLFLHTYKVNIMDSEYETYKKELAAMHKVNKIYLEGFKNQLINKGLSDKTIYNHVNNVDFYINNYLCYEDVQGVRIGCYSTSEFFEDWFVRKAAWSSCAQIKSIAASLKKFYAYMLTLSIVDQDDYDELRETIKEEMPDWLDNMRRYDDDMLEWQPDDF